MESMKKMTVLQWVNKSTLKESKDEARQWRVKALMKRIGSEVVESSRNHVHSKLYYTTLR